LEGDFFTQYIKTGTPKLSKKYNSRRLSDPTGNVLMLSEGRLGIDNVYSLNDGMVTLLAITYPIAYDRHRRDVKQVFSAFHWTKKLTNVLALSENQQ